MLFCCGLEYVSNISMDNSLRSTYVIFEFESDCKRVGEDVHHVKFNIFESDYHKEFNSF